MGRKIIIDLCGGTGSWSKPYLDNGYEVINVTLPQHDVRYYKPPQNVYGVLAAPPCTEFSFAKHFHGKGNYTHNFDAGMELVNSCLNIIDECNPTFWVLENPRGYLRQFLGVPTLTFEPWWYGDGWRKMTDLWGNFNTPKRMLYERPPGLVKFSQLLSKDIYPQYYGILPRQERRAITPSGFAKAFFEANK